ncbi:MAG: class F sortase [Nitriliruptoraceae bacterium]|nr:class F sortase [Nitriliruptoraceae bacterium]
MTRHPSITSRLRASRLVVDILVAALVAGGCASLGGPNIAASPAPLPAAPLDEVSPQPVPSAPAITTPVEREPATTGTPAARPPAAVVPDPVTEPAENPDPDQAVMAPSTPTRLQVPAAGVDTTLMALGIQDDGRLEVPPGGFPAGWFTGSPTPGERGPAIIAGHVDWAGQPGVFFEIRDLAPGDDIAITRRDGTTAHFRVTRVERFAKDAFPTEEVYGDLDHAGLRLITCGGAFDRQARSYEDNIVVFAVLADR